MSVPVSITSTRVRYYKYLDIISCKISRAISSFAMILHNIVDKMRTFWSFHPPYLWKEGFRTFPSDTRMQTDVALTLVTMVFCVAVLFITWTWVWTKIKGVASTLSCAYNFMYSTHILHKLQKTFKQAYPFIQFQYPTLKHKP